jgi:hypothetical protein
MKRTLFLVARSRMSFLLAPEVSGEAVFAFDGMLGKGGGWVAEEGAKLPELKKGVNRFLQVMQESRLDPQ